MGRFSRLINATTACLLLSNLNIQSCSAQNQNTNNIDSVLSRLSNIYVNANLMNADDASEVELMLKGAIDKASSIYGADSDEVLQAKLNLCKLYKMQSRYGELRSQAQEIGQIYCKLSPSSKTIFALPILERAFELAQYNRPIEARSMSSPVLDFIETDQSTLDNPGVIKNLDQLALALKSHQDLNGAARMYRSLALAEERKKPIDEIALAAYRTKLAEILMEQGQVATATELASLADAAETKTGLTLHDKARISTLILLSNAHLAAGRMAEAKTSVDKLQKALEGTQHSDCQDLLDPLLRLCTALAQARQYDELQNLFGETFSCSQQYSYSIFDNHLQQMTTCLLSDGKSDRAENLYTQFDKFVNTPGTFSKNEFRSCSLMMQIRFYSQTNQESKVTPLLVQLARFDAEHHTNNMNQIQTYIDSSNNSAAKTKYFELMASRTPSNDYEKTQAATYRAKLAEAYLSSDQVKLAKREWYQMCTMLEDNLPSDCKDLASEVRLVLASYARKKDFNGAQQLATNMASYGFQQSIIVSAANGFTALSQHYETSQDMPKAKKLIERGLAVAEKYGGKKTYNYCNLLTRYASILRKSGQTQLADETDKEAAQLQAELQRTGAGRFG